VNDHVRRADAGEVLVGGNAGVGVAVERVRIRRLVIRDFTRISIWSENQCCRPMPIVSSFLPDHATSEISDHRNNASVQVGSARSSQVPLRDLQMPGDERATPLVARLCDGIATDTCGREDRDQNENSDPHPSGGHMGQISLPIRDTYWLDHIGDFGPP
jgi:hypothetical protein